VPGAQPPAAAAPGDVAPAAPETAPGAPPAAPPPKKAADMTPIDVTVEGEKQLPDRPPARVTLRAEEIRQVPGAFGDAFRAIEVLPGVTPLASGAPYLFVRGATPGSSGYFLDGIRIPFLFHVGVGPSVVSPRLIDRVDFYPGGYPAQYGRYVGGIIAATTQPPPDRTSGEATIRLFDAGAFLESPIDGGRFDAFASGRYSYTAAALSIFAPDTRLGYWDYQAGAGWQQSAKNRLSVLAFGSNDYLGEIEGGEEKELFAASFHRMQLRFDHGPRRPRGRDAPRDITARLAFTLGFDESGLGDEGQMDARNYGLRSEVAVPLSDEVMLRGGTDLTMDSYDFAAPPLDPDEDLDPDGSLDTEGEFRQDVRVSFSSRISGIAGAWADVVWKPLSILEIVPGVRLDVFGEEEGGEPSVGFDPRASARLRLHRNVVSITTAGIAHQRPSILVPVPGLEPRGGELQRATQLSQGIEVELPEAVTARVTAFHHHYDQLTDLTATCSAAQSDCSLTDRADGRSYGLELLVTRPLTRRLGGILSYTLSRSERTVGGDTFLSDFDRTHILHLALGYALGRGWHAGARLTAYSGQPHSLLAFDDPEDPDEPTLIGQRNNLRRDMFHRIDVRLEKRWTIGAHGWVSVVLEGLNVTLRRETVDFDCRVGEVIGAAGDLKCGAQEIGPISIPSLGVSGGF
jgi:hypothetical protein